ATLCPDEEDRRARPVFPPHHGVADQRPEGEIRIREAEWCRRPCTVGIHRVLRAGGWRCRRAADGTNVLTVDKLVVSPRARELAEGRVGAAGDEGLRKELQCEIRVERPVDPGVERERACLDEGEHVTIAVERGRRWIRYCRHILGSVFVRYEAR